MPSRSPLMRIGLVDQRGLGAVKVADEGFEAAIVKKFLALGLGVAQVAQDDPDPRVQEGEFAQAVLYGRVVELDHGEGLGRGGERDLCAALRLAVDDRRRADHLEGRDRLAVREFDEMFLPVEPDPQHQRRRQRVDDRHPDAMQAPGDFIRVLVKFTARVQLRHDDFRGRHALLLVNAGRNAASVVGDGA